jgi:hypothetical protein
LRNSLPKPSRRRTPGGIVHRDLKPANVTVDRDGQDKVRVKVLDFGLAKLASPAEAGHYGEADVRSVRLQADSSQSPTITTPPATLAGFILGTAAYMSPEQAKGKETDRTTDIWAFGCVLYEMLTGRAAFEGETVGEILGSVFKAEPDWTRLPADTPPAIRRLLQRCLRKDAALRLRDIGDARIEIHDAALEPIVSHDVPASVSRRRERLVWAAGGVLLGAATIGAVGWTMRPAVASDAPEVRFEIATPPVDSPASFAISPDGRKLVFAGASEGTSLLWLRSLDAVSAEPLAGTDGARLPFWSPDGSIGFFADTKLKRIDVAGGAIQTLADARKSQGGAWGPDGAILFQRPRAPSAGSPRLGVKPAT